MIIWHGELSDRGKYFIQKVVKDQIQIGSKLFFPVHYLVIEINKPHKYNASMTWINFPSLERSRKLPQDEFLSSIVMAAQ